MKHTALTSATLLRYADAAGYAFAGVDEEMVFAPRVRPRRFVKSLWFALAAALAFFAA